MMMSCYANDDVSRVGMMSCHTNDDDDDDVIRGEGWSGLDVENGRGGGWS